MEINWLDWFGYLASLVILISLTMTSIIRLRWINFVGCILFAIFGFMINSYPTAFMNIGISIINIYFLFNIYRTKEEFRLLEADMDSNYFKYFIEANKKEIEKQMAPEEIKNQNKALYMLRNHNIAGILLGEKKEDGKLYIKVDYVIPQYRDYKLGKFFFNEHTEYFKKHGINTIIATAREESHRKYLKKIGFKETKKDIFEKII